MHLTITNDRIDLPPGGEVVLRHQTWLDYEKLLESRQDKAAIKIYFDAESQEIRIIAPLPGQGKKSDTLSDLVKALLRYQGQDWDSTAAKNSTPGACLIATKVATSIPAQESPILRQDHSASAKCVAHSTHSFCLFLG